MDGTLLVDSDLDGSTAVTSSSATPNTPDALGGPIFDTLSDIMSSEWLIQPAFAVEINMPDVEVQEGEEITLTITYTGVGNVLEFIWHNFNGLDLGINRETTQSVTFTAPQVDEDTNVLITVGVDTSDSQAQDSFIVTVLDSDTVTDNPPVAVAGPALNITKGSTVTLTDATATDSEDDDATLTISWTQNPDNTVTIINRDTIIPTIVVPAITTATSVILTLNVTDSASNTMTDTRVLTIQDAVDVNTSLQLMQAVHCLSL